MNTAELIQANADFETIWNAVQNLHDGVLSLGVVKDITNALRNRDDLTIDEKCRILDTISAYSQSRIIENPRSLNAILLEWQGKENPVPRWCEAQKAIIIASQSPTAQHGEQTTPPAVQPVADSNTTPQPTTEPSGIDKEALKALFMPVFFADDFKQRETLNGTTNLSRFDIFVEQLESLLSDAQCDKKRIGNIAYMVHKSRFAKNQYKRRGKFAQTCRLLFECCQREAPKDTHPNKYEQPDSNILQRFSDALGNPLNPQK